MAGVQANRFVREYGVRLLPSLYEVYNPMPYDAARDMEVEARHRLARSRLRRLAGLNERLPHAHGVARATGRSGARRGAA